jgi:hypothetical protein
MKGKSSMGKGKGKPLYSGTSAPGVTPFQNNTSDKNSGHLKCHFCHIVGHIKPNCRKWLALQTSDQYKQRNSHEPKYQLIYDHLEDSVLAPRLCQYCSDSNCDGDNCESPFDHDDYNEASIFFTQNLSAIVINAKLERPLDSQAPQTEQLYAYDDWGETYEDENDYQWEMQDNSEQYYEPQEAYTTENAYVEEGTEEDPDQADSDNFDEDDQDNYM